MSQIPTVADFMDTKFTKLSPDTELKSALTTLLKNKLLAALVVEDDNKLVGILSEKDCLKVLVHKAYDQRPWGLVKDYMHEVPEAIPSTMPVPVAVELITEHRSRRFPVVDDGKLVGQITRRDLLLGMHSKIFP
jgi:CBS domain-containing protein